MVLHSSEAGRAWEKKARNGLILQPRQKERTQESAGKSDREAGKCQTSLHVPWHLGCGCAARSITGALKICSRHTFHEWELSDAGKTQLKGGGGGGAGGGEDAEEVEPPALTQRRSERR